MSKGARPKAGAAFFFAREDGSEVKHFLFSLVAVAIGLALCLALVEVVFKVVRADTKNFYGTDVTGKRFLREVKLNSHGFRDVEWDPTQWSNKVRILALGDSYTYGDGIRNVEDRFTNLLGARLGKKAQVFNYGLCGTELVDHKHMWKGAATIKPLVVILQYSFNDIDGYAYGACETPYPWSLPEFLKPYNSRIYLISMLNNALTGFRERHGLAVSYEAYIRCHYENEQAYAGFLADYKAFVQTVQQDVRLVMIAPWPFYTRTTPYPFTQVHKDLEQIARETGAIYVDLLGAYEGMDPLTLMVNRSDPHPNEKAHRIAAETLYKALKRGK